MDFVEALKRPYTRGRSFILFFFLSFLPILNFFPHGYALRAAHTAMRNKPLEYWADWGVYFRMGFFRLVIGLVYALPVIILVAIGVLAGIAAYAANIGWLIFIVLLIGIPLCFALLLFLVYVSPAALMSYVESDRLGDAFDLRRICRRAFTLEFFIAWLKSYAVGVIYGIITIPLIIVQQFAGAIDWRIFVVVFAIQMIISLIIAYPVSITNMSIFGDAWTRIKD